MVRKNFLMVSVDGEYAYSILKRKVIIQDKGLEEQFFGEIYDD
ncbi:MAG: hypothetical protein ACI9Y1_002462 [Lentisphaeria bacterium]|jgi:hypothetical protein